MIPDKLEKQSEEFKAGYHRREQEILILMDRAEKAGWTFKRFIAAYTKLIQIKK